MELTAGAPNFLHLAWIFHAHLHNCRTYILHIRKDKIRRLVRFVTGIHTTHTTSLPHESSLPPHRNSLPSHENSYSSFPAPNLPSGSRPSLSIFVLCGRRYATPTVQMVTEHWQPAQSHLSGGGIGLGPTVLTPFLSDVITIQSDDDDNSALPSAFILGDWIGRGIAWTDNLPKVVCQAQNNACYIPPAIRSLFIPPIHLSVTDLLDQFPNSPCPSNGTALYSTNLPYMLIFQLLIRIPIGKLKHHSHITSHAGNLNVFSNSINF